MQISLAYQKYYIISLAFLYCLINSKCPKIGGGEIPSLPNESRTYILKYMGSKGHLTVLHEL